MFWGIFKFYGPKEETHGSCMLDKHSNIDLYPQPCTQVSFVHTVKSMPKTLQLLYKSQNHKRMIFQVYFVQLSFSPNNSQSENMPKLPRYQG
jgi:hypothetical protein